MIKTSPTLSGSTFEKAQKPQTTMVFGQNDRMAGSVPVRGRENSFAAEIAESDAAPQLSASALAGNNQTSGVTKNAEEDFGFLDFLDIVNPLQHIPLVSTIYQHLAGDTIKPAANVLGGALFGGPIGAAGSIAMTVASEVISGKSDTTSPQSALADTTAVAFADLRQGLSPYNS